MPKMIDLTGRRFGRLSVVALTDRRDGSGVVWRCRCDCGREVDVPARNLLHRGTVSCGCQRRERAEDNLAGDPAAKFGQVEGTNVSRIRSSKASRNCKSGLRGVSWHRYTHGGGAWAAVIYLKRTRYRLGLYDTAQEASEAYLRAKEHIHGDFVEWYEKTIKEG